MSCYCVADEAEISAEEEEEAAKVDSKGYEYELMGVTVHTGTADGGHYYSFIRDRLNKNDLGQDKWLVSIWLEFCSPKNITSLTFYLQ